MTPAVRSTKARRGARGYTVVEVLSAMTLFAIGAAGVIGMQRVTVQGGADARSFDVASNIASEWASRLHRDSMAWTLPNAANPTAASDIGGTTWLKDADDAPGVWKTPALPAAGASAGMSPAFDLYGRDLDATENNTGGKAIYCVQYRMNYLANPAENPGDPTSRFSPGGLVHAEIRVVWARLENAPIGTCDGFTFDAADTVKYHFVYLSTAIRPNPEN